MRVANNVKKNAIYMNNRKHITYIKYNISYNYMTRDRFTMGYFDNFDNVPLNKYKKILKNEKKSL
jgi:hypothetical protein